MSAVVSLAGDHAGSELARLVLPREGLAPVLAAARAALRGQALETAWAEAALAFVRINPGAGPTRRLLELTAAHGRSCGPALLIETAATAQLVCRHTGGRAAARLLEAVDPVLAGQPDELAALLRTLGGLARRQPRAVEPALRSMAELAPQLGHGGWRAWLDTGLRAYATDRARLLAYLALEDPLARERLADHGRAGALRRAAPAAAAFASSLTGERCRLRFVAAARRPSLAFPVIVLPDGEPSLPAADQADYAAAVLAHAAAHRLFGGALRFEPKRLKPVQLALIGLIEDARVETLAMRRWPGLRRLWARHHEIARATARTAPMLMARLARALFDDHADDPDGWIEKARRLVAEARDRLGDPSISREIGGLLGNDLGQMRLSFNARTYLVEPVYRDDHAILWSTEAPPAAEASEIDVAVEAVRRREEESADGRSREDDRSRDQEPTGRARARGADPTERPVIARLPEWDHAAQISRPDWVTVKAWPPAPADPAVLDRLAGSAGSARRIEALVRQARLGLPARLKRQHEGDALDLDAAITTAVARRAGETPDPRVYRRTERRVRDVATLLLVDRSASTADPLAGGRGRVIDVLVEAAFVLAQASDRLGDPVAVEGFDSAGRADVRIVPIKDFAEPFGGRAVERLAGLRPGHSTRLGAALRYGASRLASRRSYRRVLIVVSDGEPFDIDTDDPAYLLEDARRAVAELRAQAIDAFGIGIATGAASGGRIFGRGNFVPVARIEDLPRALAALYFRLSAR